MLEKLLSILSHFLHLYYSLSAFMEEKGNFEIRSKLHGPAVLILAWRLGSHAPPFTIRFPTDVGNTLKGYDVWNSDQCQDYGL